MKLYCFLLLIFYSCLTVGQNVQLKGKERGKEKAMAYTAEVVGKAQKSNNGIFEENRVIFKFEHIGNKLLGTYFNKDAPQIHLKDSVYIPYKSFFAVSQWKRGLNASVLNIPFKIRLRLDTIPSSLKADVKNIGLFLGSSYSSERFYYNGNSTQHSFTFGGFIAPTVITLNSANTNGIISKDISQLGISVGGGINYTYNGISFVLIPFGFDFGISKESKDWIYNKKYWFGFGLGIDTVLLSF